MNSYNLFYDVLTMSILSIEYTYHYVKSTSIMVKSTVL